MFVLEDCLAWIASKSSKVFARVLEAQLSDIDVTRVQWMALYYIGLNRGITQIELAEKLNSRGAAVTRLLDRMEKKGLISRTVDQSNRRSNKLYLTEKGSDLNNKGMGIAEDFKNRVISGIPDDQLDVFNSVIEKMVVNALEIEAERHNRR